MKSKFTEEFKIQVVKQITEEDFTVSSVSNNSLYYWQKRYGRVASNITNPLNRKPALKC